MFLHSVSLLAVFLLAVFLLAVFLPPASERVSRESLCFLLELRTSEDTRMTSRPALVLCLCGVFTCAGEWKLQLNQRRRRRSVSEEQEEICQ
ncbi:hypothetical protein FQA47_014524 [Oryzias melastigma]|uniref:Secreted protein n=1 Tax=Oryzias melastigma TaxID=30732 RepID=A0A834FPS7_ORYME|nr:hypothetical protein FQA47_014524 [Oryzias melastigma]